jgi:hypothetical protein
MDRLISIPDRDSSLARKAESVKIRIHRMKFQSLIRIKRADYQPLALYSELYSNYLRL